MAGDVQISSPGHCRARVDARHPGLFSCARTELREHTLRGRRCPDQVDFHHHHHGHHHPRPETHLVPIPFARYLEQQNLDYPYQKLPVGACPTLFGGSDAAPATPPALRIVPHHPEASPALSRPDVPRLGDVTPVERTATETHLRVTYRIEAPLNTGRILDLLA